ncbi:MAG: cysteine-rich CWC family protein [Caldimonas sp.]
MTPDRRRKVTTSGVRSSCPLCGGPNRCAMASAGVDASRCWCEAASFGAELLASVPLAARDRVCICAHCAGTSPDRAVTPHHALPAKP